MDIAVFWILISSYSYNIASIEQKKYIYGVSCLKFAKDLLLPSDWACLIRMIMRGFPMMKLRRFILRYIKFAETIQNVF